MAGFIPLGIVLLSKREETEADASEGLVFEEGGEWDEDEGGDRDLDLELNSEP